MLNVIRMKKKWQDNYYIVKESIFIYCCDKEGLKLTKLATSLQILWKCGKVQISGNDSNKSKFDSRGN
jgi:hypothetical protein